MLEVCTFHGVLDEFSAWSHELQWRCRPSAFQLFEKELRDSNNIPVFGTREEVRVFQMTDNINFILII